MYFVAVDLHFWNKVQYFSIHTYLHITLLTDLFKQLTVVAFTSLNHWCQDVEGLSFKLSQNPFDNLIVRHTLHFLPGHIGESFSCSGK
ncbi:hypothetical protein D3C72_1202300 [compost metagenome]